MTRNEWITQRFSTWMESGKGSIQAWEEALDLIESMANRLEARKVAPWQSPAAARDAEIAKLKTHLYAALRALEGGE